MLSRWTTGTPDRHDAEHQDRSGQATGAMAASSNHLASTMKRTEAALRHRRRRLNPDSLSAILWVDVAEDERARRAAVKTALSILTGETQAGELGPAVHRSGPKSLAASGHEGAQSGSPEAPISYHLLAEHFQWTGFSPEELFAHHERRPTALPMSDLLRQRKNGHARYRPERQRRGERRRRSTVNPQIRPGQGGRRPSSSPFTIETASRELYEEVGEPSVSTYRGARVMIWDVDDPNCEKGVENGVLDPSGSGVVLARLSGVEIAKGETIGWHVESAMNAAKPTGLLPKRIIASINNSGYRRFDDRFDALQLEEWIETGEIDWVGVSYAHRLARGRLQIEEIYDLLRTAKVDLYVGEVNRKIDWHRDDALLAAWAMSNSLDGRAIKDRTHGSIIRRYLLMGRGWPGSIRYGTKRGRDLYLVEDPKQTKIVRWIFDRFEEIAENQERGGLRRLRDDLWTTWRTRMSHERVRTILMDPLYVTGEWHVTYEGYAIACRPVKFKEPISRAQFQRVQELLALKSRSNRRTKLGEFVLNYVPFLYAPTVGDRIGPKKEQPRLRGYKQARGTGEPGYSLHPQIKGECCLFVPKRIERSVIRELKKVLRGDFARAQAAKTGHGRTTDRLGEARTERDERRKERGALAAKLAKAKSLEAQARQDWLDQATDGEAGLEDWREMVGELRDETRRLERQLALLERPKRRRGKRRLGSLERADYLASIDAILTEETPDDPDHRVARAALVQSLLSAVIIHDGERDGEHRLELRGWAVPEDSIGAPELDEETAVSADGDTADQVMRLFAAAPGIDPLEPIREHLERYAKGGLADVDPAIQSWAGEIRGFDESVNEGKAYLTESETRTLLDCLQRSERPPRELERAFVGPRPRGLRRLAPTYYGVEDLADCPAVAFRTRFNLPIANPLDPFPPDEMVRLSELGHIGTLRAAFRRGALRAERRGKYLYSTREWVNEYQRQRKYRRLELLD
jgi:hypothetical protein